MKFSERLTEAWNKRGLTVDEQLTEALREIDAYEYQVSCMRKFHKEKNISQ